MFVIQEVDEDTMSENSRIEKSQVFSQRNTTNQINDVSQADGGKLEILKEEKDGDDDEVFMVATI